MSPLDTWTSGSRTFEHLGVRVIYLQSEGGPITRHERMPDGVLSSIITEPTPDVVDMLRESREFWGDQPGGGFHCHDDHAALWEPAEVTA